MHFQHTGPWATLFSVLAVLLVGCQKQESTPVRAGASHIDNSVRGNPPPPISFGYTPPDLGTTGGAVVSASTGAPPLRFEVSGMGNHVRHVCVPATKKLKLRIFPHGNYAALQPVNPNLRYPTTGRVVYDGSPAYYNRLRVNLKLASGGPAWDYIASNENGSSIGDYSSQLSGGSLSSTITDVYVKAKVGGVSKYVAQSCVSKNTCSYPSIPVSATAAEPVKTSIRLAAYATASIVKYFEYLLPVYVPGDNTHNDPAKPLVTPEYDLKQYWILGSDPYDGLCTYWEQQLGKCGNISTSLIESAYAQCAAGEQKVLITNIVSDYPCGFDQINWCKGGQIQTVTDYQRWSLTLEAVTENTKDFF